MTTRDTDKADQIIHEMTSPIEVVVNLLYLLRHEQGHSQAVLNYLTRVDFQIDCLADIVRRGAEFGSEPAVS